MFIKCAEICWLKLTLLSFSVPLVSLSLQPSGAATGCTCCAADIESALWQLPESQMMDDL